MSRAKPKSFWDKHVKMFQESGMSQREYCRMKGLSLEALKYQLRKNRLTESEKSHKSQESPSGWLPITVIDEPASIYTGGIRFQISRMTIEVEKGFDAVQLANVLRTVGAAC